MRFADFERTHLQAIEMIRPYIAGKVVYDIGAGDGEFAQAMTGCAGQVTAVEIDPFLAQECRKRGIVTIEGNFLDADLSYAEVIYAFLSLAGNYALYQKLIREKWHGLVLSHLYPLHMGLHRILPPYTCLDVNGVFLINVYVL
jgi:23S rRNA U2552 (ribose-2'-O)-methylase RlmE/FtsJ